MIDAIKEEDGRWLYDMDDIKKQATNFFSNLYTSDQGMYKPYQVCGAFPLIDDSRLASLTTEIEEGEIRHAVFKLAHLRRQKYMAYMRFFTKPSGILWRSCFAR